MDTSFITENKKNTFEYTLVAIMGIYVLFWFPINFIYMYLCGKAFTRDKRNILSALCIEFAENTKYIVLQAKQFLTDASQQTGQTRDSYSNTEDPVPENTLISVLEETAKSKKESIRREMW